MAEQCYIGTTGSSGIIFDTFIGRHKFMCDSRQKSDYHAKGYTISKKDQRTVLDIVTRFGIDYLFFSFGIIKCNFYLMKCILNRDV